ncbi:MAG: hypothetical protein FD123_4275 [Bacteroidetes bacterium]|nr:MAG: hypothetical protein FD123_4275 [Bacteroidota bacterium]
MTRGNTAMGEKKYDDAIAAFNEALGVKAKDPAATAKLKEATDARNVLMSAAAKEKAYNEAMEKAKTAFAAQDYAGAKVSYQAALGLKSGDQPATDGIAKCDAALKNKTYADAMAKADGLFGEKKYTEAKTQYEAALVVKPSDDLATAGVKKCNDELDRIRKSGELEKQYTDAMNQGKTLFTQKKYAEARTAYTTASGLKSGEQEPKDRIKEIDDILGKLAGDAEREKNYKQHMDKASGLFTEKKYTDAKSEYQEALNIKSGDKPATDGITKCDNAIAQMGVEEKYKAFIAEADQFMTVKNFASAKAKYTDALGVKANDAYAKQKIAECDKELGFAIKDKEYISALATADSLMKLASDETSYGSAKTAYKTASALKPMENYPKDKITEIDRKLADMKTEKARRAKYDGLITKGDGLFNKKDYKGAKPVYEDALKLYPMELYPKQRLAEIDKLLNPTKVVTDPVVVKTREEIMNELVKKYPQGVTEILENDPSGNAKVTKRIVVKGNEAWVYVRKVHSWGGVYYFKDGVQISENTFNQETK